MSVEIVIRIGNQSIHPYKQKKMIASLNQNSIQSLITAIYKAWEYFGVPAIHYHYLLSVLTNLSKVHQVPLMRRELDLLSKGQDHYHIISSFLSTRQESLKAIKANVHALRTNASEEEIQARVQPSVEVGREYEVVFRSREEKVSRSSLEQLILHLNNYQMSTYEVVMSIRKWQQELTELGYKGLVQFIYKHQDYLEKIENDSEDILTEYHQFFERNPFLIFRKEHEINNYGLIYQQLQFPPQFANKIVKALEIIDNHHADCELHRLMGAYRQQSIKKTIKKAESLRGLYGRYAPQTLIVRDGSLLGDRPKFLRSTNILNNKNILVNPQVSWEDPQKLKRKRVQVSLNNANSCISLPAEKVSMTSDLWARKEILMKGVENPTERDVQKTIVSSPVSMSERVNRKENFPSLEFHIDKDIHQHDILRYLKDDVFGTRKSQKQIEDIAKVILKQRKNITLISVKVGPLLVAWLAIVFISRDHSLRKSIDIKLLFKLMVVANFEEKMTDQFLRRGYGVIRMQGSMIYETQMTEKWSQLIQVSYKVGETDQTVLKKIIRENRGLKHSRLLKYYTYSTQSKYHIDCLHRQNECRLNFWAEEVKKVNIEGKEYLRAKCDTIIKMGNVWKVQHHLNSLAMLIGHSLEDILESSKMSKIDFDSSFEEQSEKSGKSFVCLPYMKTIHRYVNSEGRSSLVQYLRINSNIREEISVRQTHEDIVDSILVDRPFVLAFVRCDEDSFGKTVAVLEFD